MGRRVVQSTKGCGREVLEKKGKPKQAIR